MKNSEAIKILVNHKTPISEFGKLPDLSWKYKRSLSENITNPKIGIFITKKSKNMDLGIMEYV